MESSSGSLDVLQERVLTILAGFEPPFILGGGGALALYLGHRKTRDLDLISFLNGQEFLEFPPAKTTIKMSEN